MNVGEVIAIGALGVFVVGVLYGLAHDVARWWDHAGWGRFQRRSEERLASECVSGAVVTDDDLVIAELDWQFEHGVCAPDPRRRV